MGEKINENILRDLDNRGQSLHNTDKHRVAVDIFEDLKSFLEGLPVTLLEDGIPVQIIYHLPYCVSAAKALLPCLVLAC